jgi:hypothetical protein
MLEYAIGVGLVIAGAVIFVLGRLKSKRVSVRASGGSVAIGGSSSAPITNVNIDAHKDHAPGHGLTVVAIVVEIIGILVVIWHAIHLTTK